MNFDQWRKAELAKAQEAERKARQGLEKCRRGPQCCSGWNQRVQYAQKRRAALQNPQQAQNLYKIGQERGGVFNHVRESIGQERTGVFNHVREAMDRGEGDERVRLDEPYPIDRPVQLDDPYPVGRKAFDDPPSVMIPWPRGRKV